MNKISCGYLISSAVLIGLSAQAIAGPKSCDNLVGVWQNEINANLLIETDNAATGQLKGSYVTPEESQPGKKRSVYPIIGISNHIPPKANEDMSAPHDNARVIAFLVRWKDASMNYGSVASWTGTCEMKNGSPVIETTWNLARSNTSYPWDHTFVGYDVLFPKK